MKQILIPLALVASLLTATFAAAQQSNSMSQADTSADSAKHESMKDCMARQKATNSGLTNTQMQTTCKNEMKAAKTRKTGNDLATGTQAGDKVPQQ